MPNYQHRQKDNADITIETLVELLNVIAVAGMCSFLDSEPIGKRDVYVGKRIKRGLFKSKSGKLINADVNGAYNIIRKVAPNAFADGVEGVVVHPLRISL